VILGITGSFGSGKTTVARIFKSLAGARATVIDADALAHRELVPGTRTYRKVIAAFGRGILKNNVTIDRAALAKKVFADRHLLNKLMRIVHPGVIRTIRKEIKDNPAKIIILDAPLLIEAGLHKGVDKLVVVKTGRDKQIKRLSRDRGLERKGILKRINSQMPLGKKIRLADFVIDNNGSIQETRKQAVKIWRLLWKN